VKKRKLNENETPSKNTRSKAGNKKQDGGISEIELTPNK
jgi:hypothetical protein